MGINVRLCVAVVMATCAVGAAACGGDPAESGDATTSPAETRQAKLDGVYRVTADKEKANGIERPTQPPLDEEWMFRSACSDDECVATARNVPENEDQPTVDYVFDLIDGRWTVALEYREEWCAGGQGPPFWNTWSLQEQPDGKLTGAIVQVGTGECTSTREIPVTLTRTGDAPANADLPDPATQPKLEASPAQGFRGTYEWTSTGSGQAEPTHKTYAFNTRCLRSADRCVTYGLGDPLPNRGDELEVLSFVFAGDKWSMMSPTNINCSAGGTASGRTSATLNMPSQPVGDPIIKLTGQRKNEYGGACSGNFTYELTVDRAGD
jgi:hypothetical protein